MYGFETCANASNVNRRRKANRLAITITRPAQVSQLRKIASRETGCGFDSLFIAGLNLTARASKPSSDCAPPLPLAEPRRLDARGSTVAQRRGAPSRLLLERAHISHDGL